MLTTSKFPIGRVLITPGAQEQLHPEYVLHCLHRHQQGDWGDVCREDAQRNEFALKEGARLVSVYHCRKIKFWIITEADRSATTILLPEEY